MMACSVMPRASSVPSCGAAKRSEDIWPESSARQPNWNPSPEEASASPEYSGVPLVAKTLRVAGSWPSTFSVASSTLASSGSVVVAALILEALKSLAAVDFIRSWLKPSVTE